MSAILKLASTKILLFSRASMSATAAASSTRERLNQRITRRRTHSVTAARWSSPIEPELTDLAVACEAAAT